jgi:EamA domain-containing membrane protein RarD
VYDLLYQSIFIQTTWILYHKVKYIDQLSTPGPLSCYFTASLTIAPSLGVLIALPLLAYSVHADHLSLPIPIPPMEHDNCACEPVVHPLKN